MNNDEYAGCSICKEKGFDYHFPKEVIDEHLKWEFQITGVRATMLKGEKLE